MKNVLTLDHLTMQFGGVVAVNDLCLEVNEGEIVALIGPNGAGKTTAFNCVTGIYEPTNGQIIFDGKTILANAPTGKMKKQYAGDYPAMDLARVHTSPDAITKLGIARTFQNIRLFSDMTVFDNVLIAMQLRMKQNLFTETFRLNGKEEARIKEETEKLLRMQELWQYRDDRASSLPYGLQRRLEIARALATGPRLLLLDEPAAGMNPQETEQLTSFIAQIRKEFDMTIFMIEHHMDLVMDISDRIYVLDFGKLISQGTPEYVQNDPNVINAYLGGDIDA